LPSGRIAALGATPDLHHELFGPLALSGLDTARIESPDTVVLAVMTPPHPEVPGHVVTSE
jgi:hypothetical protein